MSNLARVWAEQRSLGGGCQAHLLEVIASLHNDDHGFCFPSNRYLAARLRKSEATIERGLKGLEACELIERATTRRGLGGGARRRITLKGYDPVAVQRDLDERKALAKARRAAKSAAVATGPYPQNEGKVPSECGQDTLKMGGSESLVESLDDSSEPTGSAPQSGAGQKSEIRTELFDRGTRTVQRLTGRSIVKSRKLIAEWLKIVDDEAVKVLAAINAGEKGELADFTSWVTAQLKGSARQAGLSQGGERRRSSHGALALLAERAKSHRAGSRRSSQGALSLLADNYGIPDSGTPEFRELQGRVFGMSSSVGMDGHNPVDVTPGALHRPGRESQASSGSAASDPFAARNAAGLEQVRSGQWPSGCTHFVLADSDEGAAWEAYFVGRGVKPRWMSLRIGLGAYMPSGWPPAIAEMEIAG